MWQEPKYPIQELWVETCMTLAAKTEKRFPTRSHRPAGIQHNPIVLVIKHERNAMSKLDIPEQLQEKDTCVLTRCKALRYRDYNQRIQHIHPVQML